MSHAPTYAHTPGGGPAGERCRSCGHIRDLVPDQKAPRRAAKPWCAKALELARSRAPRGSEIEPDTAACKFWKPRPRDAYGHLVDQPQSGAGGAAEKMTA